mmetsp:Transcript_14610/g.30480  ORF Transcript_14610/g.30480 Transcript_14610/m.30480 type:complete len:137 (-) Transcript_14610:51-461(-)
MEVDVDALNAAAEKFKEEKENLSEIAKSGLEGIIETFTNALQREQEMFPVAIQLAKNKGAKNRVTQLERLQKDVEVISTSLEENRISEDDPHFVQKETDRIMNLFNRLTALSKDKATIVTALQSMPDSQGSSCIIS